VSLRGIDFSPPVLSAIGLDVVVNVPNAKKMRNAWKDLCDGISKTSAFVSGDRLGDW
jgi:hypothetical protein